MLAGALIPWLSGFGMAMFATVRKRLIGLLFSALPLLALLRPGPVVRVTAAVAGVAGGRADGRHLCRRFGAAGRQRRHVRVHGTFARLPHAGQRHHRRVRPDRGRDRAGRGRDDRGAPRLLLPAPGGAAAADPAFLRCPRRDVASEVGGHYSARRARGMRKRPARQSGSCGASCCAGTRPPCSSTRGWATRQPSGALERGPAAPARFDTEVGLSNVAGSPSRWPGAAAARAGAAVRRALAASVTGTRPRQRTTPPPSASSSEPVIPDAPA